MEEISEDKEDVPEQYPTMLRGREHWHVLDGGSIPEPNADISYYTLFAPGASF